MLGKQSKQRLIGLDPELVAVVVLANRICNDKFGLDTTVLEGVRTPERQAELYAQGRTAPGNVVTWTMKSRHLPDADGFGQAVDQIPYPTEGVWEKENLYKFDQMNEAMEMAASLLGVDIRWGADWDEDGNPRERGETDSPHWERKGI